MKKIFVIVLAVVVGFVALNFIVPPAKFLISRNTLINAPAEKIFPHVNNFHNWQAWSPWADLDPNAKITYEGPESGVGAKMSWSGNKEVGQGSNKIVDSYPPTDIRILLQFEKPFKDESIVTFQFKPQGDQTLVIWNMQGKSPLLAQIIGRLMNCEKMLKDQFDKGLASLKKKVELDS